MERVSGEDEMEDLDFKASLGYIVRLHLKRQRERGSGEGGRRRSMKVEGEKGHT